MGGIEGITDLELFNETGEHAFLSQSTSGSVYILSSHFHPSRPCIHLKLGSDIPVNFSAVDETIPEMNFDPYNINHNTILHITFHHALNTLFFNPRSPSSMSMLLSSSSSASSPAYPCSSTVARTLPLLSRIVSNPSSSHLIEEASELVSKWHESVDVVDIGWREEYAEEAFERIEEGQGVVVGSLRAESTERLL